MYAQPPRRAMEVFASRPDRFKTHSRDSEWAQVQLNEGRMPAFLEGLH